MKFKGNIHKRIFTREVTRCKVKHIHRCFLSAIFLLTSSNNLWQRTRKHVSPNKIDWNAIDIRGVSIQDYALYRMAKDLYCDTSTVNYTDLSDDKIYTDHMMQLIYSAIDIRRHGMSLFDSVDRKETNNVYGQPQPKRS